MEHLNAKDFAEAAKYCLVVKMAYGKDALLVGGTVYDTGMIPADYLAAALNTKQAEA